jgi:chorismate-pyruvate lyase
VGTYAIEQGTLTAGTNYNLTFVPATFTITARLLTVTADSFSRVYGGTNPTLTVSYSGFATGESITNSDVVGASAFDLSTVVDATSPVGVYAITNSLGSLSSTNYNFTNVDGTLTVTPAPLTVTADAQSKGYGDSDPTFTYQITSGSLTNGDSLSGLLSRVAGETVGTYAIQQGTLTAGTNYNLTFVPANLTITARAITVTADAQSKVYGTSDPVFSYQITSGSLTNGDSLSGLLSRVAGETVGTYAIEQGTLTAGTNYNLTFVPANLTITTRPITVTADANAKIYGDADPVFSYQITSGSLTNGDSLSGLLSRVAGETVGTYAIEQGTLTAGTNYNLTFVSANLTITARAITVTADAQSKVYGASDPALTYQITSGSLTNGDSLSGGLTRVSGESIGTYAIQQGTLTAGTNYNLTFVSADLTITPSVPQITAGAAGSGTFTGSPDTIYTVQYTDSLNPVNWQTLNTATTDGAGLGSFSDPAPLQAERYYRVIYP